jgi:hypothetical protein
MVSAQSLMHEPGQFAHMYALERKEAGAVGEARVNSGLIRMLMAR